MSIYDKASLVLIPSGTKTSKVYSQKPTNGDGDFTFSRSTAATRVNASGNIEKETQNLLLQSNTFSNASWTLTSAAVTGGHSGYDGTNTAWELLSTAASCRASQTISTSGVQTMSVYAKAGSVNWMALYVVATAPPYVYFDLANGVLGGIQNNVIDASMEDMGGGWYRCSIAFNKTATEARIFTATANGILTTTSGDSIYIQDAQLNQGLIAQEVITTTTTAIYGGITDNVPRLDYTDSSCPALLLEPQRTNSYTNSEYFEDWLSNRLDRTANNIISPEGVQNAYKMAQQSGFTTAPNINKGGIAAGTYTISIFAKKGSWNYLAISFQGVSYFNLETGSKGTINSNHTATIEDYGNGWYRCAITRTTTTTQTPAFYFAESDNTLTTPDTQGYMYAYGAQLEAGSYATSYIPTYGSAVTRNADFESDNDLVDTAISFGANDDFTLFYEGSFNDLSSTSNMIMGGGRQQLGASYKNYWWVQNATSMRITGDAETRLATTSMSLSDNTNHKLLVKRSGSVVDFFVDGSKLTTTQNNPNTAFTFRSLGWAYTNSVYKVSGNLKQALVFNQALTDQEAIDLTTL